MLSFLKRRNSYLPRQHTPHELESRPEIASLFERVWGDFWGMYRGLSDPNRVLGLLNLVRAANALEAGDYIELGTSTGMTLKLIHTVMDKERTLYGMDSFVGFDERDIAIEKGLYSNNWTVGNFGEMSAEGVRRYLGNPDNLRIVEGWFPDSFSGLEDKRWRFAHIDMDLYQPIKAAMAILWPRLVPGGAMVVHDYGCYGFPGVHVAVDEFSAENGVYPVVMQDKWGSAVFRKPVHR